MTGERITRQDGDDELVWVTSETSLVYHRTDPRTDGKHQRGDRSPIGSAEQMLRGEARRRRLEVCDRCYGKAARERGNR